MRLAELTLALSLATDLGTGQPMEHGLRTCLLSLAVADEMGLDDATRSSVYFVALLRFLGCTSDASETATLAGGDDLAFNATMAPMLMGQPGESMRYFLRHLGEGLAVHRRAGRVAAAVTDPGMTRRSLSGHCEVGARLATRLGLGDTVSGALAHAYERWDGKGFPDGLAGDEVPIAIRIVAVARDAELWNARAGWPTTVGVLEHRSSRGYDPTVADHLVRHGDRWMAQLHGDLAAAVLDAEPPPRATLGEDLDRALGAVADFVDLKSPFLRGHSSGVSELVAVAAPALGMPRPGVDAVRRAALVHDVGRVGISNGVWDEPGPLTAEQWERVRMHTYLSERVLTRCSALADLADLASRHHERVDGSGYHRGVSGDALTPAARLLAAADAFHAMNERRPHRPALGRAEAAAELADLVDAGRLGQQEVEAVLDVAGQPTRPPRIERPAGLTEREVDVLSLIARGHANKEVAARLGISPKTVGHHIEHIYAKAGVTTRAAATLFAMENGLLST
jgi:HD-GYP domain-containing protein (c-di-GMP phosphodiesterase class II)/DNA-binding CsgD family transcriptional regulator